MGQEALQEDQEGSGRPGEIGRPTQRDRKGQEVFWEARRGRESILEGRENQEAFLVG